MHAGGVRIGVPEVCVTRKQALYEALEHFMSDDNWAIASHVALSTILALFPFLIVAAAVAGWIGSERLAEEVGTLVFDAWPDEVARPIAQEAHEVLMRPRTGALTIGVVIALWFASNGVEALRLALNRAYRDEETRDFIMRRLQSLAFVVIGAIGLVVLATFVVLGPSLWAAAVRFAPMIEPMSATVHVVRFSVAAVVLLGVLLAAHLWLPAGRRQLRDILPGILITLVAWLVSGAVFAAYIRQFASYSYSATYAGLANVMIAIVFLYVVAAVVLLGAELNAALIRRRRARAAAASLAEAVAE
jgi:membrane protein